MARKLKIRAPEIATAVPPGRPLVGGRLSRDAEAGLRIGTQLSAIVPPASVDDTWRSLDLDSRTLSRISPTKLAEYLADISPEVSRSLWDFLREANAGYEITALLPGTDEADSRAQDALDGFIATLTGLYGSFDVPIARLFLSLFLRGAVCSELVLDAAGRVPVDLAVVDPSVVRARRVEDPIRGTIHQYGQMQDGRWVPFSRPTITYIPLDPLPGSPYGRAPVAPALFTALFLIGLLHDLRRVIAQQGYPRYDIEIVLDELFKQMPSELEGNATATAAWIDAIVADVSSFYEDLEPESAFVHTSTIKLNRPLSAVSTDALGGIGPIVEALERMASRSLKSTPFMMGLTQSSSEATANREWEAHLQSIKSVQHLVENLLEHLFSMALQAQGIVTTVRVRFAENRASEMQRDALTEQTRIANAREKYAAGWLSQDEAAQEIVGAEADVPEPRDDGTSDETPAVEPDENPEPGSARQGSANGHGYPSDLVAVR